MYYALVSKSSLGQVLEKAIAARNITPVLLPLSQTLPRIIPPCPQHPRCLHHGAWWVVISRRHAICVSPRPYRPCICDRFISRQRVPKSIPNRIATPIKNAPQNAKYKRLRGFSMPAAGVEPALNDDVMPSNAKLCQVPCQNG